MPYPVDAPGLEVLTQGQALGPVQFTVSEAGNERYWGSAGVDHPALRAGVLYPPIAANLTVLLTQTVVPRELLHTAQRLRCRGSARVGDPLTVSGRVARRFAKRGREYVEIEARVATVDGVVWESWAMFTPAARGRSAKSPGSTTAPVDRDASESANYRSSLTHHGVRRLELSAERLLAYSRSGNFHSDPGAASALGYSGLVAQGMQVAGPAYGMLLDAWGDDFLEHGEIELKFVGVVVDGHTVEAEVDFDDAVSTITVRESERVVVIGSASA